MRTQGVGKQLGWSSGGESLSCERSGERFYLKQRELYLHFLLDTTKDILIKLEAYFGGFRHCSLWYGRNGLHFFLTLSFQAVAIEIVSGEISNSTHSEYLKDYSKKASSILCGCIFFFL